MVLPTLALVLLLAGLCLIALPVSTRSVETEPDRGVWRTAAPAPTKRTEVAAVTLRDKIYVVGGFEQPGFSNLMNLAITASVEEYDPSTDRWTIKAPMPMGLHHAGIGVTGGRLYVIGGYTQSGLTVWEPVATVYAYDPATDTWASRAPLPTPRDHLATATLSGKVYAIGGRVNGDYRRNLSVTEVYDPVTDRWTLAANLPTARSGITGAEVGGRI
jgi:N-acetylneuraminic acid mutarotase